MSNKPCFPARIAFAMLFGLILNHCIPISTVIAAASTDELASRHSWELPTYAEVRENFEQWLQLQVPSEELLAQVKALWDDEPTDEGGVLLERITDGFALALPAAREIVEHCRAMFPETVVIGHEFLDSDTADPMVRDNLKLLLGQWLVTHQFYDEGLDLLSGLEPRSVVDPAALLFYRGAAHYWLRHAKDGSDDLAQLMEQRELLPRRYSRVAIMMSQDLARLEEDSLDEISRIMSSVQVRLGHGRAGTRVRGEEESVISKLDKLIDELEQQAQSSASDMAAGSTQSGRPMEDSQAAGGSGPGDVAPRDLGRESDWGDLPAAQREEALQQLGKDFPSHYREVIEEYFRSLARSDTDES